MRDFSKAKRIVVKIGTSSLTDEGYRLDQKKMQKFVHDAMELRKSGAEVVIVTSGAIGAGVGRLALKERPGELGMLQAIAAVGQGILMQVYEKYFSKNNQPVAQMLLTRDDLLNPVRQKNFESTLNILLKWGVVPIVNENDSVAVEEIRVGDNDMLSAFVATSAHANLLILLSDVDGLYTCDPNKDKGARLIGEVGCVTPEIEKLAGKASSRGSGGMATKVRAARIACESGIPVVIAKSEERNVLKRVLAGENLGTIFLAGEKK
jgi:glutamate 5-kinase